ncbi:MAG: UvrD-helicase domain-containing protein [Patescibacteria group bacterium]|nr:UvrD-helicase domain-containing protein [Patescibacteria group bacterium]
MNNLNPEQKLAVEHESGALLIIAGAGTGKTMVITQRIAYLVSQKKAKTDEILALTFTDKSAGEMEERVDKLLPYGYTDLWISTFHSFCERILKEYAIDIGLPGDFKLLNQTEQWLLVRQNLDKFNLDYYKPLGNPTKFIHALLTHFSRAKDEIIRPSEYLEYAKNLKLDSDSAELDVEESEKKRLIEVADAFHIYQQILLENNALDFGDLINYTLKLFKERPKILNLYRKQFKYILVDEFQDTNYAQYELIKLLSAPANNLTVVGDDDQCLPGDTLIDLPKGVEKIKNIKPGTEIVTAVGKGHLGISKVTRVFKNKKNVKLFTIKIKSGKEVTVTDNHKMFCYIPKISDKTFYYVYLMYRQDIGWRLGTTNDLSTRLRLERFADKIIGIKAFQTDEEARFFETLWSLKYGIPTSCFKERGKCIINNQSFKKLYNLLDVNKKIEELVSDLNIDINSHHDCLDAVNRGNKTRIKIHLELCQRKYRSKDFVKKQKDFILNPLIGHVLSIETSNLKSIDVLKKAGFKPQETKKGFRLRYQSQDIKKLGDLALKIQKITNGIIEYKFKVGKYNYQHLPALVIPAKNVLPGFYLPVRTGREVIYEQIIEVEETESNTIVYDLEVNKTHNFIADGVIVHNSIYKFRGASISNILQFKEDYPDCKEILLTKNYRSQQNILDSSYKFIQQNNPNRLEIKLGEGMSKKLNAEMGVGGEVKHLHFESLKDESEGVAQKIIDLKGDDNTSWSDFAILVRANNHAKPFINALNRKGVPYQFFALRGLYSKPIVLDVLSYFKALFDYHDNPAFYRILNFPTWNISPLEISKINFEVRKTTESVFEVLQKANTLGLKEETVKIIQKILAFVEKHSSLAREKTPSELLLIFLNDTEYHKFVLELPEQIKKENLSFLDQLYKRIKKTEVDPNFRVNEFLEEIEYELEAGDEGALSFDPDVGPDMVRIMTIHAAKGLEFDYVFLPNLVDKRFPTIQRKETIPIPDDLIKEILPEGDIHLEEERRLFYVAMTRAKKGLFLTSADDYGGARKKKPSRFLIELGFDIKELDKKLAKNEVLSDLKEKSALLPQKQDEKYVLPAYFSFSALAAFDSCPLQYKFSHILKVHSFGKAVFSYGKTMHNTLHKFVNEYLKRKNINQGTLFVIPSEARNLAGAERPAPIISMDDLLKIYEESWIDEWFENKKQKEDYKKQGRESVKKFYQNFEAQKPQPVEAEKGFYLKVGDYTIKGRIDRIDDVDGGVEIIDYKTGQSKGDKISKDNKKQLLIYQLASEQCLDLKPQKLTYYYLNDGKQVSFLGTDKEKEDLQKNIIEQIDTMKNSDFCANPKAGARTCVFCDFKNICNHKQT